MQLVRNFEWRPILLFCSGLAMSALAVQHPVSRSWPLRVTGIVISVWSLVKATDRGRKMLGVRGPVLAAFAFLTLCLGLFVYAIAFGVRHHDPISAIVGIAGITTFILRIVYWYVLGGRDKYYGRR
jgi:hypothetical protein